MKRYLILLSIIATIFVVGCGNKNKDILNNLKNNIEGMSSYHISGELEIINNEDIYLYDVDVSYKEPDYFRVSLKNMNNNHLQILLKNQDGVYVLTPALNKSFKFQSDWPYNNSQIYLLQTILKDIMDDSNASVEKVNDNYVIKSNVNYSNNESLVMQKVYVDNNYNIKMIEVMDQNEKVLMKMTFENIDTKPNFGSNHFEIDSSLNSSSIEDDAASVSKIESIIYPMYMPEKTYLSSQSKINSDNGERVIMTFEGDNPFMFVQEVSSKSEELTIVPVYGNPELICDSIGVLSDTSVTWTSNGIDYYVTSNTMSEKELLSVANSINVIPVGK